MRRRTSRKSSADSKEQCDASNQTDHVRESIIRCLRDKGPSYTDPKDPDRSKDGWMTQNEVFRELDAQGLLKPDTQVSSVNPGFSPLEDAGRIIQKPEVPGDRHAHQRYDRITRRWNTLWKIAPDGTMPVCKEKRQFFLVDSVTKVVKGAFTEVECATALKATGPGHWIIIKVTGSKRYKLEVG